MGHGEAVKVGGLGLEELGDVTGGMDAEGLVDEVGEGGGDDEADDGEDGVEAREPARGEFFGVGEAESEKDADGRPGAEGVVLHARAAFDGEESHDERGPDEEEEAGLIGEGHGAAPGAREGKFADGERQEDGPWRKPYEVDGPPEAEGNGIVVGRVARAEGALEVFVDDVRPEEAFAAVFGDQVPGQRDGEEDEEAGENFEVAPAGPVASGDDEKDDDTDGEDEADEAEGDDGESGERGEAPHAPGGVDGFVPGEKKEVKGGGEFEAEDGFGDHDAGEKKNADGSGGNEAGVEAGAFVEEAASEEVGHEDKTYYGKGKGEAGGEGILRAGDFVHDGDEPVVERGFFEVADAVHVHDGVVMALEHFLDDEGVGGVGVVEEGRGGGVTDVNGGGEESEDEDGGAGGEGERADGACWLGRGGGQV